MVVRSKKQKHYGAEDLVVGDFWFGISRSQESGLVLSDRVGKHTDDVLTQLIASTEGKATCHHGCTDDWGGYGRFFPQVLHPPGKENTRHLECTNDIIRLQTGRGHRRQNKFGKIWLQTQVVTWLVTSISNGYDIWIWQHFRN